MVDSDGLENRYTRKRIEGSNPSLSAFSKWIVQSAACFFLLFCLERCPSGLRYTLGKRAYPLNGTWGSNPHLSDIWYISVTYNFSSIKDKER